MRSSLVVLLCLGVALAIAWFGSAWADTPSTQIAIHWFKTHDRNGDGYLTIDEVIPFELKLMKRMDANGDGKLSIDEYVAGLPADQPDLTERYRRRFKAMDADGDGLVTPDELTAYYGLLLQTADTNGDGEVSPEEWLGVAESE